MPVEPDRVVHEHSPGLGLTFPELAAITEHVELNVTVELGPWWSATVDALGASACAFGLKPGMDLFDLLEQRATIAAWDLIEGDYPGHQSLAVAIRVLALGETGQLSTALEAEARVPESFSAR